MPHATTRFALAVLVLLGGSMPALAQAAERLNILFILTEDAGRFDSVIGTPGVHTPGLESIVERGVYVTQAHVAAPVCSVSKAAIMTGLMPHSNNLRTNVHNYFPGARGYPSGDIPPGDQALIQRMIADQATDALNPRFAIPDTVPTLIELLDDAGYYTAVTHKLHVGPVERFPYDHWIDGQPPSAIDRVVAGARAAGQPFFLLYNTPEPHRPYTDGDVDALSVSPEDVVVPPMFVDTPVVRQDWAEHLDGVERADANVVDLLARLEGHGLLDETVIVFMADHGPSWHRGKQSTYGFGSNVSFAVAGPGVTRRGVSDAVVNAIDLFPTLLTFAGVDPPASQGVSLVPWLAGDAEPPRRYSVTEVQHDVRQTNDGQNEKKITDGEYALIFRWNPLERRELNADQWQAGRPWRNRVYGETVRVYDDLQADPTGYTPERAERIERAYRLLDEMDTFTTRGGDFYNHGLHDNAPMELFDLAADPHELTNRIDDPALAGVRDRLLVALHRYTLVTNDRYADARLIPAPGVAGDGFDDRDAGSALSDDASWSTPIPGNGGADFTATGDGMLRAPAGPRALAVFDGVTPGGGAGFIAAVEVTFQRASVGAGVVFGYEDPENFYEFQVLDGGSAVGGAGKDVRLMRTVDGESSRVLYVNDLPDIERGVPYRVIVEQVVGGDAVSLLIVTEHGVPYYAGTHGLDAPLPAGSAFGLSTWSSGHAAFGRIDLRVGGL